MSTYIFELAVTHSVLILAYWIFLSQENQYHKMRFFLLGSTLLSIMIPIFRFPKLFATYHQPVQELPAAIVTMTASTLSSPTEESIITFETIMWFSLIISCLLLVKLTTRIIYLIRLARQSTPELINGFSIRRAIDINGSFTFLNWIFLSNNIDKNQKDTTAILKHEQAHVDLNHSYDLVFLEIYKAFFWWLPSSWYVNKEIKKIHEYQADACVLRSLNIDLYSSILIKTTLQSNGLNIASSFHDGLIFKRLKAMKQQAKKVNRWKFGILSSLCVFLFVTFACTEERSTLVAASDTSDKTQVQREVFSKVEEQPSYKGGMSAFYKYVINEMKYPLQARKSGTEGTVQVQFVIERDGSISNVNAINGIGSECDQEAMRVVKGVTGFKAGSQRGRTIRTVMLMPITFKLDAVKKNADNSTQGSIIAGEIKTNYVELNIKTDYKNGEWSGTVLSPEGNKMPGVNIVVAGTSYGTVSDLDGTFSVKSERDQELHISCVGYKNVVIKK